MSPPVVPPAFAWPPPRLGWGCAKCRHYRPDPAFERTQTVVMSFPGESGYAPSVSSTSMRCRASSSRSASIPSMRYTAWSQALLLDGELARCEPKRLRYRLLHVAGRITRSGRRVRLHLPEGWPWAAAPAAAFRRLRALPAPG